MKAEGSNPHKRIFSFFSARPGRIAKEPAKTRFVALGFGGERRA